MSLIKGKQIATGTITAANVDTTTGGLSTINAGDAAVEGVGGIPHKDHQHAVATGVAVEITDSTASEGFSGDLSRSDHGHPHGDRAGGTLHATATPLANGFMSISEHLKLAAMVDPNLVAPKDAVRLLAVGNVTLSGAQTIDGVATADGDRVACLSQTAVTEDGFYIVAAGAWARAPDFASGSGQGGAVFPVEEGTTNQDKLWLVTNDSGSDVVGTNDITALQIGAGTPRSAGDGLVLTANELDVVANADGSIVANPGDIQVGVLATDAQHGLRGGGTQHAAVISGGASGFMTGAQSTKLQGITDGATPNTTERREALATQAISGADTVLGATLAFVPDSAESVLLMLNRIPQRQGVGLDYTVAGNAITWLASTGTAVDMDGTDVLDVQYRS